MKTKISQMKTRLSQLVEHYNTTPRKFSQEIGLSSATLGKVLRGINSLSGTSLAKIGEKYPEINLDWLITGRGSMLREEQQSTDLNKLITEQSLLRLQDKDDTINILKETVSNLLSESSQLRTYINSTSQKYISMVESSMKTALDTKQIITDFINGMKK